MHNTLEQKAFGMLLKTIERVSEHEYTDGRNEACVKAARLLIKGYKSALVDDLVASDYVNGNGYDISRMPLV